MNADMYVNKFFLTWQEEQSFDHIVMLNTKEKDQKNAKEIKVPLLWNC